MQNFTVWFLFEVFFIAESCGEIESVKAVSDVYVPVSGTVIETNSNIFDKPSLINSSPHEQGK